MYKTWVVIRREFLERVRTKWFLIGTILGPVFMAAVIVLPIIMAERGGSDRTIIVLDGTSDEFGVRLTEALQQLPRLSVSRQAVPLEDLESRAEDLAADVGTTPLDGFMLITDNTVEDGKAEYRGANVSSLSDMRTMQSTLRRMIFAERLRREGVEPSVVGRAQIPVDLATVKIVDGKVTGESGEASFFLAYVIWFLLYMAILL
jgi:ABC-2 type transport system permease protein